MSDKFEQINGGMGADFWDPTGGMKQTAEVPGQESQEDVSSGGSLNMAGMYLQGFKTPEEIETAQKILSGLPTQSDVALKLSEVEVFKKLPPMPTPEGTAAGLEVLLAEGGATVLCEADPKNGQYFSTIELDFSKMSPKERAAIAMNPFVRALGISREKTFRSTGEGTGDVDWNDIDFDVRQTVAWDPEAKMIVAGARMSVPAETNGAETFFEGLYEYNEIFEREVLNKSAELGRTFINPEYYHHIRKTRQNQKLGAMKMALFQGVLLQVHAFLDEGHPIEIFIGAPSVDSRFPVGIIQKIVTFFTKNHPTDEVLPEGAEFFAKNPENLVSEAAGIERSKTSEDFAEALKKLKNETKFPGANFPSLMELYGIFSSELAYKNPVFNSDRVDEKTGQPAVELGLVLMLRGLSEEIEKKYDPRGEDLKWEESIRCRVGGEPWESVEV